MPNARAHLARRLLGAAPIFALTGFLIVLAASCLTAPMTPGERLARAKCGACHLRPEPGKVPRARLTTLLEEHRRRFELTEADRAALLDYLAPAAPKEGPPRAP